MSKYVSDIEDITESTNDHGCLMRIINQIVIGFGLSDSS